MDLIVGPNPPFALSPLANNLRECYDRNDTPMLEMLKPCIEEGFVIQDREVALDFIAKRGSSQSSMNHERRVRYAREIMQKELLPHISQSEGSETRKAFFE